MKKITSLTILIVISLIIVGCSGSDNTKAVNYHVGTNGLTVEPLKSNPSTIFEDQSTTMQVQIKNLGTYSLNNSKVGVIGVSYDNYYVDLIGESQQEISLHAKDIEYPIGDQYIYDFNFKIKKISNLREKPSTKITYNVCYPYNTWFSIDNVCVDTKAYTQDARKKVCTPQTYTATGGQGAPVTITKIIPEMLPMQGYIRPQFKIYIENKGTGYVMSRGDEHNLCLYPNTAEIAKNMDKVHVRAILSKTELNCSPSDLRLVDEETYTTCYLDRNSVSDGFSVGNWTYTTLLTIKVDYNYVQRESNTITIQRLQS